MSKQIVNIYWKDTDNIGDRMSGVWNFFDFPLPVVPIDIKDVENHDLKESFIILGGGGHIHLPSIDYNNGVIDSLNKLSELSPWSVTWGLGNNIHDSKKMVYPECLDKFLLNGLRDTQCPYRWVPCPSCMDSRFDAYREMSPPTQSVVFEHRDRPLRLNHISNRIQCEESSFDLVIDFLASGKTIFTNSYHGAYWGLLLNRIVVVPDPYLSKFYNLSPDLIIKGKHHIPIKSPEPFLERCRTANKDYYAKIIQKVWEYMEAK